MEKDSGNGEGQSVVDVVFFVDGSREVAFRGAWDIVLVPISRVVLRQIDTVVRMVRDIVFSCIAVFASAITGRVSHRYAHPKTCGAPFRVAFPGSPISCFKGYHAVQLRRKYRAAESNTTSCR